MSRLHVNFLYGALIFVGAFLLFSVQPLIGKYLLPIFGGAGAVWSSALLFFTTVLLFGYIYAFVISKLPPLQQALVHGGTIILVFLYSTITLFFHASPLLTPVSDTGYSSLSPSFHVLLLLAVSVGIPYFLLSTTSSLLQSWYGNLFSNSIPYKFYILSNGASLVAVLSYPTLIEPFIGVTLQAKIWTFIFLFFLFLQFFAVVTFFRTHSRKHMRIQNKIPVHVKTEKMRSSYDGIPIKSVLIWIFFASFSTLLLVSGTTQLTQAVASVPFLWLVPLALFLLSFIFGWKETIHTMFPLLLVITAFLSLGFSGGTQSLLITGGIYVLYIFFGTTVAHHIAYVHKPANEHITVFYLWFSFGGALGAFFGSILAPIIFNSLLEFRVGALFGVGIGMYMTLRQFQKILEQVKFSRILVYILGIGAVALFLIPFFTKQNAIILHESRNFYGHVRVQELPLSDGGTLRTIVHGNIIHGAEILGGDFSGIPTSYYSPTSGASKAYAYMQERRSPAPLTVGVLGLGAGGIGAYCEKNDDFIFYEIDPAVVDVATEFFSYLKSCGARVRLGDARLVLAREIKQGSENDYDILYLDVFSDDAIPVHLLTKEAFSVYLSRIKNDGMLAIHISNQYFDLEPLIISLSDEYSLTSAIIKDYDPKSTGATGSVWILLSKDSTFLDSHPIYSVMTARTHKRVRLWTDDFANPLGLLKWRELLHTAWR